jgi:hypothetical protein
MLMPVLSTWLVPYTVFLNTLHEQVTLHDFEQMNMTESIQYAPDFFSVKALRQAISVSPKMTAIVIIDPNPNLAARFIGSMVLKILGVQNYAARTLPEAARLIETLQPNIVFPELQP